MSIRETSRTFGLDRNLVCRILAFSSPPGYQSGVLPDLPSCGGEARHQKEGRGSGARALAASDAARRKEWGAGAVSGSKEYRACEQFGTWFEVLTPSSRETSSTICAIRTQRSYSAKATIRRS